MKFFPGLFPNVGLSLATIGLFALPVTGSAASRVSFYGPEAGTLFFLMGQDKITRRSTLIVDLGDGQGPRPVAFVEKISGPISCVVHGKTEAEPKTAEAAIKMLCDLQLENPQVIFGSTSGAPGGFDFSDATAKLVFDLMGEDTVASKIDLGSGELITKVIGKQGIQGISCTSDTSEREKSPRYSCSLCLSPLPAKDPESSVEIPFPPHPSR